jgi:hypothetical protein
VTDSEPDTDTDGQREALANRLVADLSASMETLAVWLGLRLGLYAALDRVEPVTAAELASSAGIDARYAREWLEQQAVAGVLVTDDAALDADERRYDLPAPHREVLLDEVSPYFVAPVTYALAGIARALPELLAAYRTGAGVAFAAYGDEIRDHIEQLNRPMFVNDLAASGRHSMWFEDGWLGIGARPPPTPRRAGSGWCYYGVHGLARLASAHADQGSSLSRQLCLIQRHRRRTTFEQKGTFAMTCLGSE